jgi:hypothetical protein
MEFIPLMLKAIQDIVARLSHIEKSMLVDFFGIYIFII